MNSTDKTEKRGWLIGIIVVLSTIVMASVLVFGISSYKRYREETKVTEDTLAAIESVSVDSANVQEDVKEDVQEETKDYGLVDLAELKAICPDVYAYIKIPDTKIDYPIAYCDAKEPFYWNHDIYGNEDEKGMIITDSLNSKDFSEHMTLVYGKDVKDGSMFGELYKFRDEDFFNTHDTVEIYLEDCKLTYTVFAAYIHPNEQILITNDFEDPISFTKYFEKIKEIRDLSAEFREDCMPMYEDYVITLVTHCDDDSKRLFVQAVLKEIEEY